VNTTGPTTYTIRVAGHLDDHWSDWFGNFTVSRNADGTSTLTGPVVDQAHLHGALAGLRDIGVTLLDLHATDVSGTTEPSTGSDKRTPAGP
jgi:hypothetical protein